MNIEQRRTIAACYCRLSDDDAADGTSVSIATHVLICIGWILPPNTYDCGSFVANREQL